MFPFVPAAKRPAFMEEIYRVLADTGKATILTNYWAGAMAYADPRVEWPPICEQTYLFFNRKWREDQKVEYDTKADFDFTYGPDGGLLFSSSCVRIRVGSETRAAPNGLDAPGC